MEERPGGEPNGDDVNGTDPVKKAWAEVSEQFSEVGRSLGKHYRRLGAEAGSAATEHGRAINDAVKDAVAELDRALSSIGDALRDDQTKENLKHAAHSLGEALTTTFSELSEEIRRRVSRSREG
jgi:hypothetical protein